MNLENLLRFNLSSPYWYNDPYSTNLVGSTLDDPIIPAFIIGRCDLKVWRVGNVSTAMYSLPISSMDNTPLKRYDDLWDYFTIRKHPNLWKNGDVIFNVGKGFIYDGQANEVLVMQGIDAKKFQTLVSTPDQITDMDHVFIMNNKLQTDDRYKRLFSRMSKDLILPLMRHNYNIDIIWTSDPQKYCLSSKLDKPKFSTFVEMKQHYKSLNKLLNEF
jgi:hypothetical protein